MKRKPSYYNSSEVSCLVSQNPYVSFPISQMLSVQILDSSTYKYPNPSHPKSPAGERPLPRECAGIESPRKPYCRIPKQKAAAAVMSLVQIIGMWVTGWPEFATQKMFAIQGLIPSKIAIFRGSTIPMSPGSQMTVIRLRRGSSPRRESACSCANWEIPCPDPLIAGSFPWLSPVLYTWTWSRRMVIFSSIRFGRLLKKSMSRSARGREDAISVKSGNSIFEITALPLLTLWRKALNG